MKKRLVKILSCLLVLAMLVANMPVVFAAEPDIRVVDDPTLNRYQALMYDNEHIDTYSAGAVWTDKSVLKDSSALGLSIPMQDAQNNFLVALSAIASNKEIIGYSAIPTDTMIILDASSSMSTASLREMVDATNQAISKLYEVGNHNRIGIAIYSKEASILLPIDRYTPANNNTFLTFSTSGGNNISITNGVKDSDGQSVSGRKNQGSGTYTQGGIYVAMQEFLDAKTTIDSGQIQGGTSRMPIFLLMTDGEASYSASHYTAATNNAIDSGNFATTSTRTTFLTMLTAAYAKKQVSEHYERNALFYTLGYGDVLNSSHAVNSLDTDNMDATFAGYCNSYERADVGDTVTLSRGVSVTKRASGTDLNYVDAFFAAESNLTDAFDDIVEEIIIQSRYYATQINGIDPDFDGYLTFEDKLGKYMEVKEIKGILHDDDYFSGAMLASHINETDLGTIERPTAFGLAFRDSVKTRLNIANNVDSFNLIADAYEAGQLSYTDDRHFSNYIGWYSDADGNYLGFWNEGKTSAPANATHKNKSYGFLGTVNSNTVSESDMMFMSIMVRTEIATGDQTVIWRVPASLMPMMTYRVKLDGTDIKTADVLSLTIDETGPVRLVYEVGINEKVINPLNVEQLGDKKDSNGNYLFWTNYFDKDNSPNHEDHIATVSQFYPNSLNERYYYTEDTPIYIKSGNTYTLVTARNHTFDTQTEDLYYHLRYSFQEGQTKPIEHYEPISPISLEEDMRKYENGQWYIKQGTVYRIIYPTAIVPKNPNQTGSIEFSHKPFITLVNGTPKATVKLGNNGLTSITPATGIKLSKTMQQGVTGTDPFTFTIQLTGDDLASSYPYVLAELDRITGTTGSIDVTTDGTMTVTLQPNQTIWITDLPATAKFTVTEVDSTYYEPLSVMVDGVAAAEMVASGTIVQHHMTDVDFVNTLKDTSGLSIAKKIEHPFGAGYTIPDGLTFPVTVTLTGASGAYANESFTLIKPDGTSEAQTTDENGIFRFNIADGQTYVLSGIHEDVTYVIEETNATGFALDANKSTALTGTIAAQQISTEQLVNVYAPQSVSPNATLIVEKDLSGRDWLDNESFTFTLKRESPDRINQFDTVGTVTADKDHTVVSFDLSNEVYTAIGPYLYVLTENVPAQTYGVTYDLRERIFSVVVTDTDMNGVLEISDVHNLLHTTVTGTAATGYRITAAPFENAYAVISGTSINIPLIKAMDRQNGLDYGLDGFVFRMTDESGNTIDSAPTDVNGNTHISIYYAAATVGETFVYTLKEVDTGLKGVNYDRTEYTVTVKIIDNYDGTSSHTLTITKDGQPVTGDVPFTNRYVPVDGTSIEIPIQKAMDLQNGREHDLSGFIFELIDAAGTPIRSNPTDAAGKTSISIDYNANLAGQTLVYTLKEVHTGVKGVTYDTTEYTVTVAILDNGDGTTSNTVTITKGTETVNGDVPFTNRYVPVDGTSIEIPIQKVMDLQNGLAHDLNGFIFELIDAAGTPIRSAATDAAGKTSIAVNYDAALAGQTLVYTLKEVNNEIKGITYDTTEYTVTVAILDNGDGTTSNTVTITKGTETVTDDVPFTNWYTPDGITVNIPITKTLINNSDEALGLKDFRFTLSGEGLQETLTSDDKGKAAYTLSFDKDDVGKTFTYTLTEVNTGIENMIYDTKTVTVSVTIDYADGVLKPILKQDGKDVSAIEVEFVNTYPQKVEIPSTGDHLPLWLALFVASAGIAVSLIYRKKIEEK